MKYIKLSGGLYLTGSGGITRVEALSDYDPNRKGNNKTLVHGNGFKVVVEETVEQIESLIVDINND